jgi:hypothetical protein
LVNILERELACPPICGIPIGSTLTDLVVIELINEHGNWNARQRWLDRARRVRQHMRAWRSRAGTHDSGPQRTLVTWKSATPRLDDLLLPVLQQLPADCWSVISDDPAVLPRVPAGIPVLRWFDAVPHAPRAWWSQYRRCWPQWRSRLKRVCREQALPKGFYERAALEIFDFSQLAVGCIEFLRRYRPAAILTEHDRTGRSACLVLAARTLGIPSFTLQHGVLDEAATAYAPVLADKMFCWGEMDRKKLIAVGVDPAKLLLGGCPRLTRELATTPAEGRGKLGLPPDQPLVLLGTSPVSPAEREALARLFCEAENHLKGVSFLVRLHPSEKLEDYAGVMRDYPAVRFCANRAATLDESLAAADVVVVSSSGVGGDALVKRRPVIVVGLEGTVVGHGVELVECGGCPRVFTPVELAVAIRQFVFEPAVRQRHVALAEAFVKTFCDAFGAESAARVVQTIQSVAFPGSPGPATS